MWRERTDDVEVGVEEDGAMLVAGLTLIHGGVTKLHVPQDQDTTRDAAAAFLVDFYREEEEEEREKKGQEV